MVASDLAFINTLAGYEIDRRSIKLDRVVGSGRYSRVWKASLNRAPVAVKEFNAGTCSKFTSTYNLNHCNLSISIHIF